MQTNQTRRVVLAAATGLLTLGLLLPASAASANTATTMEVTGGSISISVPTGTVDLGTTVDSVDGSTIVGALGQVQVEDARNAPAGSSWVATAISTAFTPSAGTAIAASSVGYTAGPITKVGTATYTANDPTDLTAAVPVVSASSITGSNSATWTPNIDIRVPGSASVAVYTATITHSVS